MLTIIETPVFQRLAREVWSEDELDAFKVWLAADPLAGDVIPGTPRRNSTICPLSFWFD